ncbi:ABC transporter permease subunit [Acetobacter sp. TBRC 12305]|uniref:ABC transporter permease subunit n=1 Tax=Acetobacter garciniae TaxID=2817435 RepID=A0A939HQB1_9PROT|nr:ABC transporter permease subunit [Acetobacter garciniae]MBO1325579.1 ABC transporter permease subunit [Acetobacter garciniae]MBX0345248.1 ABC transporter permease subunit [Acetobacter garciniae]
MVYLSSQAKALADSTVSRAWRAVTGTGLLLPLSVLLVWQLADRHGGEGIPNPAALAATFLHLVRESAFWWALLASIRRVMIGFACGALVGVATGLALGGLSWMRWLFGPVVSLWRYMPIFSLIPLLVLWLGLGEPAKLVLVALATSVPVTLSTYEGMRVIPQKYQDVADMFGLTFWVRLKLLLLPAALPFVANGLRQGLAFAWMATVVSELFLSSGAGLSELIVAGQEQFRPDLMLIGIAVIAITGIALNKALDRLIHYAVPGAQLSIAGESRS